MWYRELSRTALHLAIKQRDRRRRWAQFVENHDSPDFLDFTMGFRLKEERLAAERARISILECNGLPGCLLVRDCTLQFENP